MGIPGALFKGFTARSVLSHLSKQSPKYANLINNAVYLGYTANSILTALTGDKKIPNEGQLTAYQRYKKSIKSNETKTAMKVLGTLGTAGAIGAAAYGMFKGPPLGSPRNPQVLGAIPPTPNTPIIGGNRGQTINQPGPTPASPRPGLPQYGGPIPPGTRAPSVINAGYEKRPIKLSSERQAMMDRLPEKRPSPYDIKATPQRDFPHLASLVEKSLSFGKSPAEIYDSVKGSKFYSGLVKQVEEKTGTSFLDTIHQLAQEQGIQPQDIQQQVPEGLPQVTEQLPQEQQEPQELGDPIEEQPVQKPIVPTEQSIPELPKPIDQPKKSEPLKEKEEVITPTGAGEIKKIKGNDAYIEEDGKLKKVPLDQVQKPSPEVEECVREAVHKILDIPEEDRSSNISLFTYDPMDARAYFQFHNGESYVYLDMDPNIVENIAQKKAVPITSGQNQYGEWSPNDKESIGASLWAYILKNPKYKKAGKGEPVNPFYRKLETKYDYYKKMRIQSKRKK